MAALSAICWNAIREARYALLVERGRTKIATVAFIRRLFGILSAIVGTQTSWRRA